MRFQVFFVCLAATGIVGCETRTPYSYTGRVVDRRGYGVGDATVIGHTFGPVPEKIAVIVGGPVQSDGTFELPSTTKLDEIVAVSRGAKREVTLEHPRTAGNILVLP